MTPEEFFKKTGKRPRRLRKIAIEEISAVDSPATGVQFLICKSKEGATMEKELVDFLGEDFDLEKALGADAKKAVADALGLLTKYKDDFPPDVLGAIKTLTAAIAAEAYGSPKDKAPTKPGEGDYGYPAKKSGDKWPGLRALAMTGGPLYLAKAADIDDDDPDAGDHQMLVRPPLRAMKKSLDVGDDGSDEPVDKWPSLSW
jgi:hypothetical protein